MKRDEMISLIESGKNPIDVTIMKWKDMLNNDGSNLNHKNCALCYEYVCSELEYLEGEEKEAYLKLDTVCPIAKVTGYDNCNDTPYIAFVGHVALCKHCIEHTEFVNYCSEAKELIKLEIEFLETLKRQ